MSAPAPLRFPAVGRRSFVWMVGALWSVAVMLSTAQVHWRHALQGRAPDWGSSLAANLIAWLPWLALAPLSLWLARRYPVHDGNGTRWGMLAAHAGIAFAFSCAFTVYLTFFRLGYLEGRFGALDSSVFRDALISEAGSHILPALLLYGLIVALAHATAVPADRRGSPLPAPAPARLVERSIGRTRVIDAEQVDWIEASGSYATLHLGERSVLVRRSLASLQTELAEQGFVRIHRSTLVRLATVTEVQPATHGEAWVVLAGGKRLKVSRTYRPRLRALLA